MNHQAWDVLLARLKADPNRPAAEQLRLLAAVQEQLAVEIADVLRIAADGVEGAEAAEEDEEDCSGDTDH